MSWQGVTFMTFGKGRAEVPLSPLFLGRQYLRFPAYREQLRLFRTIATMDPKAPIPPLRNLNPTWTQATGLAKRWKLNQLAGRLAQLAGEPERFA